MSREGGGSDVCSVPRTYLLFGAAIVWWLGIECWSLAPPSSATCRDMSLELVLTDHLAYRIANTVGTDPSISVKREIDEWEFGGNVEATSSVMKARTGGDVVG
jgi:hypothetical protein